MKYNLDYYNSPEWMLKRSLKLMWGKYKCEKCGSKNNPQIHHKHYKSFGDEMPWDLIILCEQCHKDEHYVGKPDSEMVINI